MNRNEITKKIEDKVQEVWSEYPGFDEMKVEIAEDGSYVDITLSKMYSSPTCTFGQMAQLSQFFRTTSIGQVNDWQREGCETCDYGSDYGFTLRISKPQANDPPISQSKHGWFLTD